jgi:hypothetical protein
MTLYYIYFIWINGKHGSNNGDQLMQDLLALTTIKMIFSLERDTFIVMSYYGNVVFTNNAWNSAYKNELFAKNINIQEISLVAHF